jgi:predicted nucleotidyltransferase
MLTQKKIKETLEIAYPYLADEYGVKRIGLFGSYAHGYPTEESDIDLVVEFEQPLGFRFVEFIEHLESLLGKKVEVLTPAGIQGIRLPQIAQAIEDSITYV